MPSAPKSRLGCFQMESLIFSPERPSARSIFGSLNLAIATASNTSAMLIIVNACDIHQIHLPQFQSYPWPAARALGLQRVQVLRATRPAQANAHAALTREPPPTPRP